MFFPGKLLQSLAQVRSAQRSPSAVSTDLRLSWICRVFHEPLLPEGAEGIDRLVVDQRTRTRLLLVHLAQSMH